MSVFSIVKDAKKLFLGIMVLFAIFFIAGCKQPSGGGDKKPTQAQEKVITKTETVLKSFLVNAVDLLEEANLGDDWSISLDPVDNTVESVPLVVVPENPKVKITVTVNEVDITDWKTIPLKEGNNGIIVTIKSADGSKSRVIRVSLTRLAEAGKDVSLAWLNFWQKATGNNFLVTKLDSTGTYDVGNVWNNPSYAEVNVQATDKKAKVLVKCNSTTVDPGKPNETWYPMNLAEGDNSITVTVTSKDMTVTKTYTIKVYRYKSTEDDVTLGKLTSENDDILSLNPIKKVYPATQKEITIHAKANSTESKVAIGQKPSDSDKQEDTKKVAITEGNQIIPIYVLAKSGRLELYEFVAFKASSDARLASLNITHDGNPVVFDFNPADTDISVSIPTPDTTTPITIKATGEGSATVTINGDAIPVDGFKLTEIPSDGELKITVTDNKNLTKTYTLHFVEKTDTSTVEVKVFSAVGQSVVAGTQVSAYKAGTTEAVETKITNSEGAVTFKLETGVFYDFVATMKGRCGSRVQNYYVLGNEGEKLQMIQRKGTVGERHEAPSVVAVKLQYDNETPVDLKLGDNIEGDKINSNSKLLVSFKLPSKLIGGGLSSTGNFNVGCEIGRSATSLSNFTTTSLVTTTPDGDGNYTVEIKLGNAGIPNGSDTLFITAYDTAENRVDYHLRVNFLAKTSVTYSDATGATIERFYINTQRYPRPLYTFGSPRQDKYANVFGVPKHDSRETSFRTLMTFWVKDKNGGDLAISGYEIYRRVYVEGAGPLDNWERVATKLYSSPNKGYLSTNPEEEYVWGRHWANDTDNDLTEMTVYQYKIVAFTDNKNRIESPIATTALYPSFNIKLISPTDNAMLNYADLEKTVFKFKLSDTTLWDSRYSDSFTFGLIVSEKSSLGNIPYGVKIRYNFNAVDDERLSIEDWDNNAKKTYWRTLKDLKTVWFYDTGYILPGNLRVEDLISFDKATGVVTIKSEFLKIGYFNSWNRKSFTQALERGANYHWDIQNYGNDAGDVYDDVSASFLKEWVMLDSKTGEPIYDYPEIPRARTGSNFFDGENALNGRFAFSIR